MNKVYKKLRLKEVVFSDCSGVVCGYVSNRFLIAVTTKLDKSFRKFDKEDTPFIEEEYKDVRGNIIGKVIISRCSNCGKIKSIIVETVKNY